MLLNKNEYFKTLEDIKGKIQQAQYKAIMGVNREQIELYWNIGKIIIANSQWGNKFIDNLARDIKADFPNAKGYSVRNLKYMRKFAELFDDFEIVQATLAQLTWYHNMALMDKVKDKTELLWYAEKTLENGWTRDVLVHQIEYKLYQRQEISEKAENFTKTLTLPQSELAKNVLKQPYVFDFIEMRDDIIEREIENEMVANITKTLLELGTGFTFAGHQYHIEVSKKDYYMDMLFYNTKLHCYVVIELKTTDFKPEYTGQLNFYLSAVDDMIKSAKDNPTIGILLCKTRDKLTAEYALRNVNNPIGVSEYKLSDFVPAELENILPSVEDIEKRINLDWDDGEADKK